MTFDQGEKKRDRKYHVDGIESFRLSLIRAIDDALDDDIVWLLQLETGCVVNNSCNKLESSI